MGRMPISTRNAHASSSRRPANREPSDVEEEIQPSDEERRIKPRRRANGNNYGDEEDGDLEKEDGWTLETFQNLPISRKVVAPLQALDTKLREMIHKIDDGIESAYDTAKALEDANPDDETIDEIEQGLLRAIEQRQIIQIKIDVLQAMQMNLRAGELLRDVEHMFTEESKERTAKYMSQTSRAKFKDEKLYKTFRESLWEINHVDKACPPMSRWLQRESGDESDDEDFEMGGATQQYRCPLTRRPFEDPVMNSGCSHSYSRAAIDEFLENNRRTKRPAVCPEHGCKQPISKASLAPNPTLAKRTKEYHQRLQRRAEQADSDVEEGIDISQD